MVWLKSRNAESSRFPIPMLAVKISIYEHLAMWVNKTMKDIKMYEENYFELYIHTKENKAKFKYVHFLGKI